MIHNNPKITLAGVDRKTNQPVVNVTGDFPSIYTLESRVTSSLCFKDTRALRRFIAKLNWIAEAIDAGKIN